MRHVLILLAVIYNCAYIITADINSGCPRWGCLSSGSFSLSSGVPASNGAVNWSTEIVHVPGELRVASLGGCVSDQVAVVCAIHSGYVYLDPLTGRQMWNHSSMRYPYLPVMDVTGDVIGMDEKQLVYVESSGFSLNSIDISVLRPAFSVMLANNSMLLIASPETNTAQIVTYNVDGIVCGALSLRDTVENVNGTFVPAGHPIIAGYRAYVITKFVPDVRNRSLVAAGTYRLYAIDLLNHMDQRVKMVWYFNLKPLKRQDVEENADDYSSVIYPVVSYLRGTIYVNIPVGASGQRHGRTYRGILWGLRDDGDAAFFLFCNVGAYGQMVVYDTYADPGSSHKVESGRTSSHKVDSGRTSSHQLDADQTIWIASNGQNLITGYSSKNGSFSGYINITELANIDVLTSQMAITRQSPTQTKDVLIFGGTDRKGTAYLVAMETDSSARARLLWKTKFGEDFQLESNVTWTIVGQVVNIAQRVKGSPNSWQLGVVAMVVEHGQGYTKLHIKAIF